MARAEGVHHAYAGKLLRLTLLAPDVVEAVLDDRLPKGVRLEDLVRPLPADWMAQRQERFGRRADPPAGTRSSGAGSVRSS